MTFRLAGVHHVSALSAHIERTHAFYPHVLGMRPVIRTVNQDDPGMYHLFYGDGVGSPGSDMTVFGMPRAAREHRGNNSITRTTFRVHGERALAYWAARLNAHEVAHRGVTTRDGRRVLDFDDPVGTRLSLVDDDGADAGVPRASQGEVQRELHVVVRDDLPRARYGSGAVHHVALRVPDGQAMDEWVDRLRTLGYPNSGIVDRHYFTSAYVREPNGVLFELATDGPGFAVDGPLDGDRLSLPPALEPRRAEIEARLPALPAARHPR